MNEGSNSLLSSDRFIEIEQDSGNASCIQFRQYCQFVGGR